jgi:hypothetical protein
VHSRGDFRNLDCLPQSAHHECDFNHKTVASTKDGLPV